MFHQIYGQTSEIYKVYFEYITASADYFRGLPQIYGQTSEIYEACFNIFHSECRLFSRFTSNIRTNSESLCKLMDKTCFSSQWAQPKLGEPRHTKLTLIFHSDNAKLELVATKRYSSPKRSVCFGPSYSSPKEYGLSLKTYSRFTSNIATSAKQYYEKIQNYILHLPHRY